MGKNFDVIKPFLITTQESNFFKDILGGQIWRIITPIFLHFSILHIFLQYVLALRTWRSNRKRKGSKFIATLILIIAAVSNLSELIFGGPIFGGMSGVVYGLFGYVWTKCRFDPGDGLYIHQTTALIMLGWFFFYVLQMLFPESLIGHMQVGYLLEHFGDISQQLDGIAFSY